MSITVRVAQLFALLVTSLCVTSAAAQDAYPSRAIRMIVPFQPGGASDIVARIIGPRLSQELGQQVVVDNRTGASGNIGVEVAAKAPPDGYTIFLGNSGTMVINPAVFPDFPIRPVRDLLPVALVVDVPGALVTHPSLPVKTVKEFIAYAKARPGQLNYGSSGAGSPQRLSMEYFMKEAGLKIVHVPYKGGAGAAVLAVVSGEVTSSMTSISAVLPHVQAGKMRALAVVAQKRMDVLPAVPSFPELGFPGLNTGAWQGVYVPLKTPQAIVDRLFAAVNKVMAEPAVVKRLNETGSEIFLSKSQEEFAGFMKAQTAQWAKLVKDIGLIEQQ